MNEPKSVLFVCTGNTCRSPLAEGIFRQLVDGRDDIVSHGSAGVSAIEGDRISPETAAELKRRAADLVNFRSRSVTEEMLREVSYVFAMTGAHLDMLVRSFPEYAEKYYLVCDFIELNGHVGVDVPDPIGMGARAYKHVAEVLEQALPTLIEFIEEESREESE